MRSNSTRRPSIARTTDASEVLIAYVYGDTPPDFAAIAACGFTIVCLDMLAPWFREGTVAEAKAHGLVAVAFKMGRS